MMGLDHVPVIMHFGPEARAPKKYENNDPNDQNNLLRFFATQSGADINVEEILKPEPSYSLPIILVSIAIVLAGLVFTGILPVSIILQNSYIWSISIMVNILQKYKFILKILIEFHHCHAFRLHVGKNSKSSFYRIQPDA